MGYHFEESKVRLYLKVIYDEELRGAFDIRREDDKKIIDLLKEKTAIENRYNEIANSLQEEKEEIEKRRRFLDREWKELESLKAKPDITVCMTEEQLREAIEKELREKYAYELEDLNLGVAQ